MRNDEEKVEALPAGMVVMMLEGYKKANENQQTTIEFLIGGWVATVVCFALLWCIISR